MLDVTWFRWDQEMRAALTQELSHHLGKRGAMGSHKEKSDVNSTLAFFMLKLANPICFSLSHQKLTGAIIYCTLYCIKYVTDITVHLYINILFNMLYMCIQQTQTV